LRHNPFVTDWHLYIVRCDDGSLYTGVSTDVARRFREHQRGGQRAARYLRSRKPVAMIFTERVGDRSAALIAEHAIKCLEKVHKEALARGAVALQDVLVQFASRRSKRNGSNHSVAGEQHH
jgi:putative endonuclease